MGIWRRRCGTTVIVSVLVASPVLLVSLPAGAAAAPTAKVACAAAVGAPDRQFLLFNVCGPRGVTRANYDYTVVLTNAGHASTGKVKLSVFHDDRITRSSISYRASVGRVEFGMYDAVWKLGNLAPGRSFRITVTVSFRQHKKNSGFTELVLRASGQHPGAEGAMKKDVFFK